MLQPSRTTIHLCRGGSGSPFHLCTSCQHGVAELEDFRSICCFRKHSHHPLCRSLTNTCGNTWVRLIGCPDMGCGLRGLLRGPSSPLHLPLASLPVSTSTAPPTQRYKSLPCNNSKVYYTSRRVFTMPMVRGTMIQDTCVVSAGYRKTIVLSWRMQ